MCYLQDTILDVTLRAIIQAAGAASLQLTGGPSQPREGECADIWACARPLLRACPCGKLCSKLWCSTLCERSPQWRCPGRLWGSKARSQRSHRAPRAALSDHQAQLQRWTPAVPGCLASSPHPLNSASAPARSQGLLVKLQSPEMSVQA